MFPEFEDKLGTMVGDNVIGDAMEGVNPTDKGYGKFFDYQAYDGDEMLHFGESVDNSHNVFEFVAIPFALRQGDYIVHGDIGPGVEGD